MTDYNDMIDDRDSYIGWLVATYTTNELAYRAAQVMRDAVLTVNAKFGEALALMPAADLADFIAANSSSFDTDDQAWQAHCEQVCVSYGDASMTVAERNRGTFVLGGAW